MIQVEQRNDIAILKIAHGKVNALDLELCEALTDQLQTLQASTSKAVILIGNGNMFSAGVDLLRLLDGGAEYLKNFLPALCTMFEAAFFFPRPLVAAVNGHAVAGGCVLACAGDHRIMARGDGRIGVTELLVGVPFPTIAMEIIRSAAVPQHFQELLYGGATFSPEEAIEPGLTDEVVEPQELLNRALATAERLIAIPTAAFDLTKRQIRQPVWERLQQSRSSIDPVVQQMWSAPETLDAIRGYVARTFKKSSGA